MIVWPVLSVVMLVPARVTKYSLILLLLFWCYSQVLSKPYGNNLEYTNSETNYSLYMLGILFFSVNFAPCDDLGEGNEHLKWEGTNTTKVTVERKACLNLIFWRPCIIYFPRMLFFGSLFKVESQACIEQLRVMDFDKKKPSILL